MNSRNLDLLHFHRRAQSLQGDAMDLTADGVVDLTVSASFGLISPIRIFPVLEIIYLPLYLLLAGLWSSNADMDFCRLMITPS